MSIKYLYLQLIFFLATTLAVSSCEKETPDLIVETPGFIWDAANHCAFTDIIEYNGVLYCCFREANNHVSDNPEDYGVIRVICSKDGDEWESIGTVSDPEYDLRDPRLLISPDGRLMIHYGRRNIHKYNYKWNCVKFISTEELAAKRLVSKSIFEISIDNDDKLSNYWIWKPKWINNEFLGVAYKKDFSPVLVKSSDGINYTSITTLNIQGNEADIELDDDGRLAIIIRGWEGNGYIGYASNSSFPTEWEWEPSNIWIQSPCIFSVDGHKIVAGRSLTGTSLFLLDNGHLYPIINFECSGDYAYPGMAIMGSHMYISYYTTLGDSVKVVIRKVALEEIRAILTQIPQ